MRCRRQTRRDTVSIRSRESARSDPDYRKSELVREALGDHIFEKFIENKKIEWDQYRIHVSQYELDTIPPYPVVQRPFRTILPSPLETVS